MQEIYITQKGQEKNYLATNIKSSITKEEIKRIGFLIRGFSKNKQIGRKELIVSYEDLKRIKSKDPTLSYEYNLSAYEFYDIIKITITEFIPEDAYLRTENVPKLRNAKGDLTVFSAVEKQIGNETVEDNTVYANRAIYQRQEGSLTIEERDQKLLERDIELDAERINPMEHLKKLQQGSNNLIEQEKKEEKKLIS